jgi:hypothetical protein
MNPNARRIIRIENINGVLHALWDDGEGGRCYKPLQDHNGELLW